MLVMSAHYFQAEPSGILRNKDIASSTLFRIAFKLHIALGIVAIAVGPMQFAQRLRVARRGWHRAAGYVYFGAVFTSAVTGLVIAQFAMGGVVTQIGFSLLATFWFASATLALRAILRRDVRTHQQWMYINYGLTFAAITQRTLLLVPLLSGIAFMPIYQLSAWLPWILNTGIAWYFFQRVSTPAALEQHAAVA